MIIKVASRGMMNDKRMGIVVGEGGGGGLGGGNTRIEMTRHISAFNVT